MPQNKFKEPIPVAPFLEWFEKRARVLAVEFGEVHDQIGSGIKLACEECGWSQEAGARRYHRWRFESKTGMCERAMIEDALDLAGVNFFEVYPEVVAEDEELWYREATVSRLPVFARTAEGWRRAA